MKHIFHTIQHTARAAAVLLLALLAAQTAGAQTNVSTVSGFAEAFDDPNVSVVNVTDNITGVGGLPYLDRDLTINLNGHTISGDYLHFNVELDGSLTINGGGSVGNIISSNAGLNAIDNDGTVTLRNVNITTNFDFAIGGFGTLNIGNNVSFNGWTGMPFDTPYVNNTGHYSSTVVATVTVGGTPHYFENSDIALAYIVSHPDNDDFSLSGTTYTIHTATGWDAFCDMLEAGETFSGKTVELANDITVTRMAGLEGHEFQGTFDGNKKTLTVSISSSDGNAAPFREIMGATIRNLKVSGTVSGHKHSAGLVSYARGADSSVENTIENCLVATDVSTIVDTDGDCYLGGIVGHGFNCKLTIRGCAFTGSLTSPHNYTGGLQGWSDGNTLILENDIFAASSVNAANVGFHPIAIHANNKTTTATVTNVYYTVAPTCTTASRIAAAGKQARSITAGQWVTVAHAGVATLYATSGITAYKATGASADSDPFIAGLLYNNNVVDVLYAGSDDVVSLTLSNSSGDAPAGYQYSGDYSASGGATLSGSTLTMDDEDVTVSFTPGDQLRSTGQAVPVSYIDADGQPASHNAIALDGTEGSLGQNNQETWYYVGTDITVKSRIYLTGDMNLIIADGYTLDVKGIYIPQGSTLTIYAESDGETAGKIVSHPTGGAAIGGKSGYDNGNIVIYGGNIEAAGGVNCAGIGSADGRTGTITIYGGTVTAKGGNGGAAIGGGWYCDGGTITINGGNITANVPTDTDTCENGAGIGGGDGGDGGNITINGGNITTYSRDGAGIGGGDDGDGGNITINGGEIASIKVNQGQGALIGGGCDAAPGTITINGGTITTEGGSGAGIGGGKRNLANGTVTINGGVINASGSYGIGAGEGGANFAIILGWTSTDDRITASTYGGNVIIADGKSFHNGSEVLEPGTVTDMTKLNGKTLIGVDVLQDDAANDVAALATRLGGKQTNIALSGRKLWKDSAWNTLVLPFSIANIEADGCPLNGATVRQLSEAYVTGTTLTLNFDAATTAIAAGVPYIVKWEGGTEGQYTQAPVFQGVTVSTDTHDYDTQPLTDPGSDTYDPDFNTDERVRFIGTYDHKTIDTEDRSILFLGAANTLYYPSGQSATTIGPFRAYFKIGDDGALAANARQLTAFNLTFGDENETTGISDATTMPPGGSQPPVWRGASGYTLDGRKLQGQPTRKGLYIHCGKKVVIK